MSAVAKLLEGGETARGTEVFSRRPVAHGGQEWTVEKVRPGARHRELGRLPQPARPPARRMAGPEQSPARNRNHDDSKHAGKTSTPG